MVTETKTFGVNSESSFYLFPNAQTIWKDPSDLEVDDPIGRHGDSGLHQGHMNEKTIS